MRNRETLGNVIFADPTASKAVEYVSIGEKRCARKQLRLSRNSPDSENVIGMVHTEVNPVVIYPAINELAITQPPQILKTKDPQTARITEIRKQLESLWIKKESGEISPKEYRERQQELAGILHDAERQMEHKPIRTKVYK